MLIKLEIVIKSYHTLTQDFFFFEMLIQENVNSN